MDTAICLHNVTKKYESFTLDHVTMEIPKGCIVGLVGENGAGKTTLLKAILNMIHLDEGQIYLDGTAVDRLPNDWKKNVGVILTGLDFAKSMNAREIGKVMAGTYENWQQTVYEQYLERFKIEPGKKIQKYSKGMKMKLHLAIALSHQAKLLIFDEATSGLDPIVRDDILDILLEFVQEEDHTALISSHIVTDLEKVADYIAFLHEGHLKFYMNKDEILYRYGVVRCSQLQYQQLPQELVKGVRKGNFSYEVLVSSKQEVQQHFPELVIDDAGIEDVILYLVKGERV